jgi:hypothetical protein
MAELPELSEAAKRKLELQWETVRDKQKLTDEDVSSYDQERHFQGSFPTRCAAS